MAHLRETASAQQIQLCIFEDFGFLKLRAEVVVQLADQVPLSLSLDLSTGSSSKSYPPTVADFSETGHESVTNIFEEQMM